MKHYGDITKISGYDVEPVWIVTGGSPCQDLSVAGKRAGLDGQRSGLFMEQLRIIKEMRERDRREGRTDLLIRPRYMVWENVCGAFSSNKGEDFRVVLEETAKIADPNAVIPKPEKWTSSGAIVGDGWSIAWRVHDAQFWGVPQRRKRVALVADFGSSTAPEILFERKSMSGNIEQSRKKRQGIADNTAKGAGATNTVCFEPGSISQVGGHYYDDNKSGTLRANAGDNQKAVVCETIGVDGYNQSVTGGVSKSLNQAATDSDHIPMVVSYGFDQGATRDVGKLFIEEKAKAVTNGTCPGHHNGVVCFSQDAYDKYHKKTNLLP